MPYDDKNFWTNASGDGSFQIELMGDYARRRILEIVNPKSGDTILDAGCGQGRLARPIATAGARVIACDQDTEMLQVGIDFENRSPLGIIYSEANITRNLPTEDASVDTIVCNGVLMHCTRKGVVRFFREAQRVLRPGGRIVGSVVPHRELLEITLGNSDSQWIRYDAEGASFEDILAGKTQVTEYYKNGKTGQTFDSPVYFHDEAFFKSALTDLGFSVAFEYISVTPEMLVETGFTPEDPTVGVKSYNLIFCGRK